MCPTASVPVGLLLVSMMKYLGISALFNDEQNRWQLHLNSPQAQPQILSSRLFGLALRKGQNSSCQLPTGDGCTKPGSWGMKWDQVLFSNCFALPRTALEAAPRQCRGAKPSICSRRGSQETPRTSNPLLGRNSSPFSHISNFSPRGRAKRGPHSSELSHTPQNTPSPDTRPPPQREEVTPDICTLAPSRHLARRG